MALSTSSRPVRERGSNTVSRRRTRGEPALSSSSEDSEIEPSDLAQLRQKRASYYSKSAVERAREARPMAQERRRRSEDDRVRRASATIASSTPVHRVSSRTSVTHRRRRKRRSKDDEPAKGGDYVYQAVTTQKKATRQPSIIERTFSSSRASLGLPQRSTSQRTTQSSKELPTRRHSYHGDIRQKQPRSSTVERSTPRRVTSLREVSHASSPRSTLDRSQTTKTSWTRPSLAPVPEDNKLPASSRARPTSVFGSIFGPSSRASVAPEAKVTCLTCLDDFPESRTAKLDCGHRMCRTCLKRIFTMSVTDPAHMPPKCCTAECIPLKHVDKLFDTKFKVKWNRKYQEYTTANRLYCPSRGCGAWIRPKDIRPDPTLRGRRYGKCARCRTKVCATCNNRWHTARTCPHDEETKRFVDMAKEQGWQRCFNCQATVELKEGCNHMTCRCTAQFCMICGAKWKTCDCPWFNYATVETDRLEHMNVAQIRRIAQDPAAAAGMNRPRAYHEELERRREQERRDEALARRMQGLDLDRHLAAVPVDFGARPRRRRATDDPAELDHEAGVPDSNFIQRATTLLTSPVTPARVAAADRLVSEIRQHQSQRDVGTASPATSTSRASRRTSAQNLDASGRNTPRAVAARGREAERLGLRSAAADLTHNVAADRLRPRRATVPTTMEAVRDAVIGDPEEDEGVEVFVQRSSAAPNRKASVRAKDRGLVAVETITTLDKARTKGKSKGLAKGKGKERTSVMVHPIGAANSDEEGEDDQGAGSSSPQRPPGPPAATLAGLHRMSTQGRVDAWRRHVGPGIAR